MKTPFSATPGLARSLGTCLAILILGGSPILAAGNSGIVPPDSTILGKTYGQWAARWWQWGLSIPEARNPIADTTGQFSDQRQHGPVYFLAGTFGASVERTATIPADKLVFIPVFNWIFGAGVFDCQPTVPGVPCDVPTLQAKAAAATESATLLEAFIDGVAVENITQYRAASPRAFPVVFPKGAVFGIPSGAYFPHVADGYWLMLKPLSPGAHTIEINVESSLGFGFQLVYNLTVLDDDDDDDDD